MPRQQQNEVLGTMPRQQQNEVLGAMPRHKNIEVHGTMPRRTNIEVLGTMPRQQQQNEVLGAMPRHTKIDNNLKSVPKMARTPQQARQGIRELKLDISTRLLDLYYFDRDRAGLYPAQLYLNSCWQQ